MFEVPRLKGIKVIGSRTLKLQTAVTFDWTIRFSIIIYQWKALFIYQKLSMRSSNSISSFSLTM